MNHNTLIYLQQLKPIACIYSITSFKYTLFITWSGLSQTSIPSPSIHIINHWPLTTITILFLITTNHCHDRHDLHHHRSLLSSSSAAVPLASHLSSAEGMKLQQSRQTSGLSTTSVLKRIITSLSDIKCSKWVVSFRKDIALYSTETLYYIFTLLIPHLPPLRSSSDYCGGTVASPNLCLTHSTWD